ncbi:hypothetical protein BJX96DRAFT_55134 [Aspergillus floccosus]
MDSSGTSSDQGSANHPPRSSRDSNKSMMSIENSISDLVGNSMDGMKQKLLAASDSAQSAWSHLRSMVTGTKDDGHCQDKPDKEEIRRINSMEEEQVAEFLRHMHRSDAHSRLKRP